MTTHSVLLSLGSNIAPAAQRVQQAIREISRSLLDNTIASGLYLTPPLGGIQQSDFVNAAVLGTTAQTPEHLHTLVKQLEASLGRMPRPQWHEREIDIDVILMNGVVLETPTLHIPHPRFRVRRFVLQPAADIAPEMVDPISGLTIVELLHQCPDTSVLTLLTSPEG